MISRKQQQYKATQYWHRPSTLQCSKIKQTNQTYQTSTAKQLVEIGIGKKKQAKYLRKPQQLAFFFGQVYPNLISNHKDSKLCSKSLFINFLIPIKGQCFAHFCKF